jgi:carboxypeptidase PM20D1
MLKRILLGLLLAIVLLVAAVAVNTWTARASQQLAVAPAPKLNIDDSTPPTGWLSTAITFRTVSSLDDPAANAAEFRKLHAFLAQQFPKVHATLKRKWSATSLLYTWGHRPAGQADRADGAPGRGAHRPRHREGLAGRPLRGRDQGRLHLGPRHAGTTRATSSRRWRPWRCCWRRLPAAQTVYLVMGADEEVSGLRGALPIASCCKSRKVRLDFVIDEGLLVPTACCPA